MTSISSSEVVIDANDVSTDVEATSEAGTAFASSFQADHEAGMANPEYAAVYHEEVAQLDRAVDVACPYGSCSNWVDPLTGKIIGGFGDPLCVCQHLPGWRSPHPAGTSKPATPVKVRGRHGSRIQRSKRRHRVPQWIVDFVGHHMS